MFHLLCFFLRQKIRVKFLEHKYKIKHNQDIHELRASENSALPPAFVCLPFPYNYVSLFTFMSRKQDFILCSLGRKYWDQEGMAFFTEKLIAFLSVLWINTMVLVSNSFSKLLHIYFLEMAQSCNLLVLKTSIHF